MIRRLPIIPTLIVLAAAAVMVALGIWQLQRAQQKERLIARYQQAQNLPPITWPTAPLPEEAMPLFRHATGMCLRPIDRRAVAGQNRSGEPGYSHIVECAAGPQGMGISVDVGWSKDPNARVNWPGGLASGIIAPDSKRGMRLVAASAAPGLQPSAPPSISSIPNNHRAYAVQWFAFAALALLIFGLAVRKRMREGRSE